MKKTDEVDLFGDSDKEEDNQPVKKEVKIEAKPKKAKPAAKTIFFFDVKVYEESEDFDALAKKVLAIEMDGLVWNKDYKLAEIAYGMKKLQIACVVEDDKIFTDDIIDIITAWEDVVQSVDIASMQKL